MTQAQEYWGITYTGKKFVYTHPEPEMIDIVDIAHALSQQCRYGGHTKRFYSVAEHSCHVAWCLQPELQLWGLLHDASEAYLCDIPWPLKQILGQTYKDLENKVMLAIAKKWGLAWHTPMRVQEVDLQITANEKRDLLTTHDHAWMRVGDKPIEGVFIFGWEPKRAERTFLDLFLYLTRGTHERERELQI